MPPSQLSPRQTRVSGPNSSSNVNMNPGPPHGPVRALVAGGGSVQTTATTAQSSLLASSLGGCDRTSANSGTFRTTTTVATLRLLSRGDSSSMAPPVSETSYWDNELSVGSQYYPYGKLASNMRDRKPSEGGALNTRRDDRPEPKRRPSVVQLGQGKWPDDFIDAFKSPV